MNNQLVLRKNNIYNKDILLIIKNKFREVEFNTDDEKLFLTGQKIYIESDDNRTKIITIRCIGNNKEYHITFVFDNEDIEYKNYRLSHIAHCCAICD